MNTPEKGSGNQDGIFLSTSTSPPNLGLIAKAEAETLRQSLSTFTSVMGVTNCGTKFLTAKVTATGREIVEVTDRCRNKHVCPNCMGYSYWKHAKALAALLPSWIDSGGSVYTQTLTLPNRNKPLIYKHIDLAETWTTMGKTKRFSNLKKKYEMVQYLRVLEDVLRVKSSFPHFHLTWFFQPALSDQEMRDFSQEIAELWADSALKAGVRGTQPSKQWAGPISFKAKTYARYIFKHGYFDHSFEPNSPQNSEVGLKPLEFLRALVATGDFEMLNTWMEYEAATANRHRIQPSRNFRWSL
jgi:hypothetical protein